MMQRFLWRLCMAKVHRLDRGPVSVKELLLSNQVHFDNKDVLASITEWNIYTCWLALHFGSRMSSRLASSLVKEAALNFLKFYHWPPGKLEQVGTCDISWCWPLIPCRCISRVWVSEARRKYMYFFFSRETLTDLTTHAFLLAYELFMFLFVCFQYVHRHSW